MEFNFPRRYSLKEDSLIGFKSNVEVIADPYQEYAPFHFRVTDLGMLESSSSITPGPLSVLNADRLRMMTEQPDELLRQVAANDKPNEAEYEFERLVSIRDAMGDISRTHNLFAFPSTHTFCGVVIDGKWHGEDVVLTDHRGSGIPLNAKQRDELLDVQLRLNRVPVLYTGSVAGLAQFLTDNWGKFIIRSTESVQDLDTGKPVQWIVVSSDSGVEVVAPAPEPRKSSTIEERNRRAKGRQHALRQDMAEIRQGEARIG